MPSDLRQQSTEDCNEKTEREIAIRELFPQLTEDKLQEVGDFLDGYCEILLGIYERMVRDQQSDV